MWCNNPEGDGGLSWQPSTSRGWRSRLWRPAPSARKWPSATAFKNGADFVLAGMFDFQVEADVKIAIDSVKKGPITPATLAGIANSCIIAPCAGRLFGVLYL